MEIKLDFSIISNKEQMFDQIKTKLNNDEFHGNNLDALYDVLSYEKLNVKFIISNIETDDTNFNKYIITLLSVLKDLVDINDNISIDLI